jgi:GH24 family phage-related lysozyme (muramidase)
MYNDTAGKVTVGVGLMLPDAVAAAHLPFAIAGRPATPAEIEAEFARVEAMPMGRPALFYRGQGRPELAAEEIDRLLRTVLTGFEQELRTRLPGYDTLPAQARIALLDMIYNLGATGLFQGFPRFIQAVEAGNWKAAADASERRDAGRSRNDWTRSMLLGNVIQTIGATAEGRWKRLGYGLVGLCAAGVQRLRRR